MMEYLKEGFHLANRNLHLVIIRIFVTILITVGLVVSLGVPLFIAFIYLGFDLAHAENMLPYLMENPAEFLARYSGLVALVGVSLFFYLLSASLLVLYSLSGTLGVLKTSALQRQYRFSLASFFSEARRNFSRLFWLISIESLILLAVLAVLIISVTAVTGFLRGYSGAGNVAEMFLSSFLLLSIVIFGSLCILVFLVAIVVSVVVSVIEEGGAGDTFKRTYTFLKKNPRAFFLPVILFLGIMVFNSGLFFARFSYNMAPLIFPFSLVLSVFTAVLQNYLTVIAWGVLVAYYIKASGRIDSTAGYEI